MTFSLIPLQISNILNKFTFRFCVILLLLNLAPTGIYAQEIDSTGDPGDNPEWQMNMGIEAYGVENYTQALTHFNKAIGLMGQTNLDIQYYKANCNYKLNQFETALEDIELFFNLQPDSAYVHFKDMAELKVKIETYIKQEEEDYQRAVNSNTIILYDAYLKKYPNGKHVDEINAKKAGLAEDKAYQRAININHMETFKEFLRDYPESSYREQVEAAIDKLDEENFNKAISSNTENAYKNYLATSTSEERKTIIQGKLDEIYEIRSYDFAVQQNSVPVFKEYLTNYPDSSARRDEIQRLLKVRLLTLAKEAEDKNNYDAAADYYDDLLNTFPNVEDKDKIIDKRDKARKKSKLDETPRRAFVQYAFDADAEGPANVGIAFGSIKPRGGGGFLLFRANSHLFQTPDYEHTNDSAVNNFKYGNTNVTDTKRIGRFEFMMGFNRRLVKPLWFYGAFGLGLRDVYYQVEETPPGGPTATKWSKNSDESQLGYLWGAGLTANVLKFVTISAGITSFNSDIYYPSFRIGFSWVAKDQE